MSVDGTEFAYSDIDGDELETFDLGPTDGLAVIARPKQWDWQDEQPDAVEVWLPGHALRDLRNAINAKLSTLGDQDAGLAYSEGYNQGYAEGIEHERRRDYSNIKALEDAAREAGWHDGCAVGYQDGVADDRMLERAAELRAFYDRPWWERPEAK